MWSPCWTQSLHSDINCCCISWSEIQGVCCGNLIWGRNCVKNVKDHLITLDRPLGIQEAEAPRNSRKSAYRLPPAAFTPQDISLLLISVRGWVDLGAIVRPVGLGPWQTQMTPSSTEHATIQLVAQCLNRFRHRFPYKNGTYALYRCKEESYIRATW
jgi:hypothetical protein